MADHATQQQAQDMSGHERTYEGFLKGSMVLGIVSFLALIALVNVGFGQSLPIFKAFAGLIIGILAVLIDVRSGGRWYLSLGVLAVFALITAMNIA
jgi:Bacterial aa3 type cytochrome c oxidase subunit IV